jgi:hypothetical protein
LRCHHIKARKQHALKRRMFGDDAAIDHGDNNGGCAWFDRSALY